jgi:hypothetical protein
MASSVAAQADGPLREAAAEAATFFAEMVLPSVAEFLRERADKRRGCLACLALASMSDHFFRTQGTPVAPHRDADSCRRSHAAVNWSVGTIIGIANATKHALRKPGRVGFGDVFADDIAWGNLRCGWPINSREVMVQVAPDNLWLLSDLVGEAARYWAGKVSAPGTKP